LSRTLSRSLSGTLSGALSRSLRGTLGGALCRSLCRALRSSLRGRTLIGSSLPGSSLSGRTCGRLSFSSAGLRCTGLSITCIRARSRLPRASAEDAARIENNHTAGRQCWFCKGGILIDWRDYATTLLDHFGVDWNRTGPVNPSA
jgi:hypothetical protein